MVSKRLNKKPLLLKLKRVVIILLLFVFVAVTILFFVRYFNPKAAGIKIETNPVATVYVNGEQIGRTPFAKYHEPGDVEIKLVPESFDRPLAPFEVKTKLVSGIETVILRNFGETDEFSSGEIVSFEQVNSDETGLIVISEPDGAQVSIDGVVKGFTPYKNTSIVPGTRFEYICQRL